MCEALVPEFLIGHKSYASTLLCFRNIKHVLRSMEWTGRYEFVAVLD